MILLSLLTQAYIGEENIFGFVEGGVGGVGGRDRRPSRGRVSGLSIGFVKVNMLTIPLFLSHLIYFVFIIQDADINITV